MFPRSRSGASVEGVSSLIGVAARRVVIVRFGMYVSLLAVLTGSGLFFLAGLRDAASWAWFAFATLGGMLAILWAVHATLESRATQADLESADDGVDEPGSSTRSVVSEAMASRGRRTDLDEVDYLMALRHEFRTPLNAVLGFSDVLLSGIDGDVSDSQREDLEIIRGSGIRLRILLDSALDLSQLSTGELRLNAERVDVRELVARVAEEAGQLWSNKRTARCTLPRDACITSVDESRLRRSILVLADFLAADQRDADIALTLALSGDYLTIEVVADPSTGPTLGTLPTPAEILASEDAMEIRRWPVAVTSEVIARHEGSLYHGDSPSRFRIRLPLRGAR